ncbi:MAG: lipid A biosynthesis lauroyl acyltransferase [Xanthomonadales bacterium]|nr:Lipid A biosynthesis lauroyltransferase [Xanthomonadales bacterium]MCC6591986.1 lipid A biosynthesis lauroyl acyltransferase [Xanthomonadales bacterium]MCE7930244.1 lipid A biosynthesis lauroyl acyltransferase [Xanthomonadales bacterium PRO6]
MKSDADIAAERLRWRWRLLFACARLYARLPYRVQMRIAWTLAWPLAWLAGSRRAIVAANIALCFPELDARAQRRLVARNLRSTAVSVFETALTWFAPPRVTRGIVEVEGLEHLQRALAGGKGALCLYSHFTMIELGGRLLSEALGRPMHQMVRRNNDAAVEAVIDRARRGYCGRTLEKKDLGELLRSLREGHPVGYAPDQNFNLHMAFVPFFGQPAATLTMTSRIARLSRAPVLCVWIRRRPEGHGYHMRIEPPLANFPGADPVADTARIIALLEAEVRKAPEQYLWAHRRFKTRPDGAPMVYAGELLKERHRR